MGVVVPFAGRVGKTALQWHHLALESKASGRSIICVRCERPYTAPPTFGMCPLPCGSYAFGVKAVPVNAQEQLELDMHAGEK